MKFLSFSRQIISKGALPLKKILKLTKGSKSIILCPKCNAVFFEKSWKHLNDNLLKFIEENSQKSKILKKLCPADQMIENYRFEGEIIIKNLPSNQNRRQEILNIIKNIAQKAYERDPLDRLISIEDKGVFWRVLLTDNNLALSMGKQIVHAFKGSFKVNFSRLRKLAHVEINLEQKTPA